MNDSFEKNNITNSKAVAKRIDPETSPLNRFNDGSGLRILRNGKWTSPSKKRSNKEE